MVASLLTGCRLTRAAWLAPPTGFRHVVRPLHVSPALSVTDIQYYREVDQSHMHLVEAQSKMRKFLLKLKEREMAEQREREREIAAAAEAAGEEVHKVHEASTEEEGPLVILNYVERGPSEVLRAITRGIGRDDTAPEYKFHDDPYLIPYNSLRKREYIMAKDGGKRAARYILDKHPELFEKNLIEMDPPVKAFMPRLKYSAKKASVEMLKTFLEGYNVTDAVKVYKTLKKNGVEVDQEIKQELLELVCFYNEEQAVEEDFNLTTGVEMRDALKYEWKSGQLAEEIYSENPSPRTRSAILCGMARFAHFDRGWQMFLECKANGDRLSTCAYNAAIRCVPNKSGLSTSWLEMVGLLSEMKEAGAAPSQSTLIALLRWLRSFGEKDYAASCDHALSVVAELRAAGIQPSLGGYKALMSVFCKRRKSARMALDVIELVSGRDWSVDGLQDDEDLFFFPEMMTVAANTDNMALAYKTHELLLTGDNHTFMLDYGDKFNFYKRFLNLLLKHESLATFMSHYERLVPHTFSPTTEFLLSVLRRIKMEEASYVHAPRLWTDLQASRFNGARKDLRLDISVQFLEALLELDVFNASSPHAHLATTFVQIAREVSFDAMSDPDHRSIPIDKAQHAAAALDASLRVMLKGCPMRVALLAEGEEKEEAEEVMAWREDDWKLACDMVEFCAKHSHRMPGFLREETLTNFLSEAMSESDAEAAMTAITYAAEAVSPASAAAMGAEVAAAFRLSRDDRKKLDSLFSHEAKWTMLN